MRETGRGSGGSRLVRRLAPAVAAALVAGTIALATVHDRGAAPPATPAHEGPDALVVTANLQDAIRDADAGDTRDLDTFAHRLAADTPRPPDVLLLTEVLGPGAHRVATRLGAATDARYAVVVAPGRSAFLPDGAVRESAILVNRDTMRVVEEGRFVRVQEEDQAVAVVARKGSDLRLATVSAHVAGDPLPAAQQLQAAVTDLAEAAGGGGAEAGNVVPVLGGDYRAGRCVEPSAYQPVDCAPQAFWTALTTTHGYDDALFAHSAAPTLRNPVHLFARGSVRDARVDAGYLDELDALPDRAACKTAFDTGRSGSAPRACRSAYYADAPFGWAVVAAGEPVQRSVAPASIALDHCELGVRESATLARVVNNTDQDVTDEIAVTAADPLRVTPRQGSLTVPAGQAATLPLQVTAPQPTDAGSHTVTVTIGPLDVRLTVSIPADCTEAEVVATSYHSGFPPTAAIDDDVTTFWHSEYSPPTPLPQSITLNLGETRTVDSLTYQPRFDGNLNGTISAYTVYTSTDGQTFTEVTSGTWPVDARAKTAEFTPVPARYVRLEATAASGGSYCSAAEITVG